MIEVVYKGENDASETGQEIKVPKNVRQIGETNAERKIYVEDYVMTYLKDSIDDDENVKYGVLLGNIKKANKNTYVFVKGLAAASDVMENSIIFNDDIWTGIYQDIKDYFDSLEIVGWYVSVPYRVKDDMAPVRKQHLDNFAGNDKVCYLDDRTENEDGFYVFENGRMEKQKGYYIYYEKNPGMQNYIRDKSGSEAAAEKIPERNKESLVKRVINMTSVFLKNQTTSNQNKSEKKEKKSDQPVSFREIAKKSGKRRLKPGYTIGAVAVIALLLSAAAMINNYSELKDIRQSLAKIADENQTVEVLSQIEESSETTAENEESDMDDEENSSEASDSKADSDDGGSVNTTDTETDEEEDENSDSGDSTGNMSGTLTGTGQDTYDDSDSTESSVLSENYCIVEPGQTLYDISMTYYNSSSMVDEIKEANGIDDDYTIYEGQKIILP